jgi:hypothetical protein
MMAIRLNSEFERIGGDYLLFYRRRVFIGMESGGEILTIASLKLGGLNFRILLNTLVIKFV